MHNIWPAHPKAGGRDHPASANHHDFPAAQPFLYRTLKYPHRIGRRQAGVRCRLPSYSPPFYNTCSVRHYTADRDKSQERANPRKEIHCQPWCGGDCLFYKRALHPAGRLFFRPCVKLVHRRICPLRRRLFLMIDTQIFLLFIGRQNIHNNTQGVYCTLLSPPGSFSPRFQFSHQNDKSIPQTAHTIPAYSTPSKRRHFFCK